MQVIDADAHAGGGQLRQCVSVERQVLGLRHIQREPRQAARVQAGPVEQAHGSDQLLGQGRSQPAAVALQDVQAHFVVHGPERLGAVAALAAGQGLAQDDLADHRVHAVPHRLERALVALGGVQEVDLHARRDDPGRIVADLGDGAQQCPALAVGGADRIGAQPQRQPVDLQELGQVTHAEVLEQEGHGQHATQRRAGGVAVAGAVPVHDPSERRERRAAGHRR